MSYVIKALERAKEEAAAELEARRIEMERIDAQLKMAIQAMEKACDDFQRVLDAFVAVGATTIAEPEEPAPEDTVGPAKPIVTPEERNMILAHDGTGYVSDAPTVSWKPSGLGYV
jgi:hypothetical protein